MAFDLVTTSGATALGLADYGLAEFLRRVAAADQLDEVSTSEALAGASGNRALKGGRRRLKTGASRSVPHAMVAQGIDLAGQRPARRSTLEGLAWHALRNLASRALSPDRSGPSSAAI